MSEAVSIGRSRAAGLMTAMNMLLGVDTPASGMVLYDGHDLMQLDRLLFRRQIAVVRQGCRLLAGSIWQQAVRLADAAGVGKLLLFHHDPSHDDDFLSAVGIRPVITDPTRQSPEASVPGGGIAMSFRWP
jgi:ABC-type cobalamin/Fe3+-siderophores transport system ATPase subunit